MAHQLGQDAALALLSAAAFGSSGVFAASLLTAGWSRGAAVTARLAIAAVVLTAPAVPALRGRWALLRRDAGTVALFGLAAVAGCRLCCSSAVQHLDVGVAVVRWDELRAARR